MHRALFEEKEPDRQDEDFATRVVSWARQNLNEQAYVRMKRSLRYDDLAFDTYVNQTASDSTDLISTDRLKEERNRWGLSIPYIALGVDTALMFLMPILAVVGFYKEPRAQLAYWLVNFIVAWGFMQLIPE